MKQVLCDKIDNNKFTECTKRLMFYLHMPNIRSIITAVITAHTSRLTQTSEHVRRRHWNRGAYGAAELSKYVLLGLVIGMAING